jgi:cellulose biosynthesis protein BcsQ
VELATDKRLSRVTAIINGKGGVGKTTTTANLAGQLAGAGYRVLAADLDLSGNLQLDLGYVKNPLNDEGKALVSSIWDDGELPVIKNVRENLDVIAGGKHLEMLAALSFTPMATELFGGGVPTAFAGKLAAVADDYDIILLDCAPGNPILQDMALAAARYVLIPTKSDAAGWEGLRGVGPRVKKARATNPSISYLGVVLFAHQTTATRILRSTKARLGEVGETVPMFETFIRHSETAAHDCRVRGQLAHELARDAGDNARERLQALRGRKGREALNLPAQLSGSADSLAGDYKRLAAEFLLRIQSIENPAELASVGS